MAMWQRGKLSQEFSARSAWTLHSLFLFPVNKRARLSMKADLTVFLPSPVMCSEPFGLEVTGDLENKTYFCLSQMSLFSLPESSVFRVMDTNNKMVHLLCPKD